MNHLHQSEFEKTRPLSTFSSQASSHDLIDSIVCMLSQIPPERVGLNGEYDHAGLAKRVQLAIRQQLGDDTLARLEVSQRGKVVIFRGHCLDQQFIHQITQLALELDGADFVEIYDDSRTMMQRVA